jgi:hypothetical protein
MIRIFSMLIFLFLITQNVPITATATIQNEEKKEPYLIGFHENVDKELVKKYGGEIKRVYKYMPVIAASISEEDAEQLAKEATIEYLEEESICVYDGTSYTMGDYEDKS